MYSPHQSLWPTFAAEQKNKLIHDHAASDFEDFCRARFAGAQRYWERGVELDFIAPDPEDSKRLLMAKVKWRHLSVAERRNVLRQLESMRAHSSLRAKRPRVRFKVFDASILTA